MEALSQKHLQLKGGLCVSGYFPQLHVAKKQAARDSNRVSNSSDC